MMPMLALSSLARQNNFMFDREGFESGIFYALPVSENHPTFPRHRRAIISLGECGVMAGSEASSIEEFKDRFHTLSGLALTRIIINAHQRASMLSIARYHAPDFLKTDEITD